MNHVIELPKTNLTGMLSAGNKWITRLLWGCVLLKQCLMDGESGLRDTGPAGDPEFRASAVAKRKAGTQHFPPLALWRRAPEPDTGSWWMWAMTERRSQTASAPELRCSFTITTIHPPPLTAVLQGPQWRVLCWMLLSKCVDSQWKYLRALPCIQPLFCKHVSFNPLNPRVLLLSLALFTGINTA